MVEAVARPGVTDTATMRVTMAATEAMRTAAAAMDMENTGIMTTTIMATVMAVIKETAIRCNDLHC